MIWLALMAVTLVATALVVWLNIRWVRWRLIRAGVPVRERRPSRRPIRGDFWLWEHEEPRPKPNKEDA